MQNTKIVKVFKVRKVINMIIYINFLPTVLVKIFCSFTFSKGKLKHDIQRNKKTLRTTCHTICQAPYTNKLGNIRKISEFDRSMI